MRQMSVPAALVLALALVGSAAQAAPCRDAKGKFIACPTTPQRCRAPSGAFAKCGTPGAKPVVPATTATVSHTVKAKPKPAKP